MKIRLRRETMRIARGGEAPTDDWSVGTLKEADSDPHREKNRGVLRNL